MHATTVTDAPRAIRKAISDVLEGARRDGHQLCQLGDYRRLQHLAHRPGDVPRGLAKAIANRIRQEGYTVATATAADMQARGNDPMIQGYTVGIAARDGRDKPFSVTVKKELSAPNKVSVLLHEGGHALLKHPPQNENELDERILQAMIFGVSENTEDEIAADLGAAAIAKLAGLPLERHYDYIAHRSEGITPKAIADARRYAEAMWPAVAAALS